MSDLTIIRAKQAKAVCDQAYIIVGVLLDDLGDFDSARGQKLLDNLLAAKIVHDDLLPWESIRAASPAVPTGWMPIETAEKTRKARLVWCPENKNQHLVTWDERYETWAHFGGGDKLAEVPTHWKALDAAPSGEAA